MQDDGDALLVALKSTMGETWLVGSIHLRPDGLYSTKLAALKLITQTALIVDPAAIFIPGDFNSQMSERSPLTNFVSTPKGWEQLGMKYVGEPTDVTHILNRKGVKHATSIDHGFTGRGFSMDCSRDLLPGIEGHLAQHFTVRVQGALHKPFGWKRYAWKKQTQSKKELQMGVVEIFWYRVWLENGTPDEYMGVYHHLADTLIYGDPHKQKDQFISKLKSSGNPTSLLESWGLRMAARELKEVGLTDEDLEKLAQGITSATKSHLKFTRAGLGTFWRHQEE